MLQSLWLGIKNKFRTAANRATDISGAGREHIHNIGVSIEELINQRDEIAAEGVLLERPIKDAEVDLEEYRKAVQAWHGKDEALMQQAYAKFQTVEKRLNDLRSRYKSIQDRVARIDVQIAELKGAKEELKDDLAEAAIIQTTGRVATKIEDVHSSISAGPLAGAIEQARRDDAIANVRRARREGEDESVLLSFNQPVGTSLADILGETPKRGQTEVMNTVNESPFVGVDHKSTDTSSPSTNDSSPSSTD